jgi:acyl dehydratase
MSVSNNINLFRIGDTYQVIQEITPQLMSEFQNISRDDNPMHIDDIFARNHGFRGRIAYGNLMGAVLSRLVGVHLPTREVLILKQALEFRKPGYVGDEIRLVAEVVAIREAVSSIQLKLDFYAVEKDPICTGQCLVKCL